MLNEILYRWRKAGWGANLRLCRQKFRKTANSKIKVCFFLEEKSIWLKSKPIYEAMLLDERFEPFVLVIPNRDLSIEEEFAGKNAPFYNIIWAYNKETGVWYDLEKEKVNFVFFARPYGSLLPEQYRSDRVSRYAQICYIPYGVQNWCLPVGLEKEFLKNVSIFFADDTYSAEMVKKFFPISYSLRIRKIEDVGYPFLAEIQKICESEEKKLPWWNTRNGEFRVVWTPRWTVEEKLGESHFFEYKDFMLNYFIGHDDVSLVFRPHPLAFTNWIEKGKMTQQEASDYINSFDKERGLYYDNLDDYHGTFEKSDVLVTDYSSIIVEYFITGKPIIYCSHDLQIFNEPSRKLMEVCYLVDNQQELEEVLNNLKQGIDPFKQEREKAAKRLQEKHNNGTTHQILDILAKNK